MKPPARTVSICGTDCLTNLTRAHADRRNSQGSSLSTCKASSLLLAVPTGLTSPFTPCDESPVVQAVQTLPAMQETWV